MCPEGYSCVFEEGNAICRKLIGTGEQHLDFQLSDIPMAIDKRVGDRKTSDVFFLMEASWIGSNPIAFHVLVG